MLDKSPVGAQGSSASKRSPASLPFRLSPLLPLTTIFPRNDSRTSPLVPPLHLLSDQPSRAGLSERAGLAGHDYDHRELGDWYQEERFAWKSKGVAMSVTPRSLS